LRGCLISRRDKVKSHLSRLTWFLGVRQGLNGYIVFCIDEKDFIMSRRGRNGCSWLNVILGLAAVMSAGMATAAEAHAAGQLFHNEDSTQIFFAQQFPPGKAGEVIDRYVDVMAEAGVTVFLCNTNSRRTNYRSRVWDAYWDGYDPAGPDDQPFLAPVPRSDVKSYRNLIGNMLAVDQQGIDYPARVIERCRRKGMSPWITLRMNDCHFNDISDHPFHGTFWKKNPQLCRKNCPGYFATCLDYAHPEVRDFYRNLIAETLDRYDIDGLELDFMREAYLFSAGKEVAGLPILTGWMRDIRKLVEVAAARRGHPVRLGVRVPSRPETALGLGLDAVGWAREGLIDLLVVTPRWATLEFDMPLAQWRQLLAGSKTTLAGGLEVLYRPWPGGPASPVSPALAAGAATSVLAGGADTVYLFNYFQGLWAPPVYKSTLGAMASLDSLLRLPRCVGITYRDVTAPNESYRPPLPASGKDLTFSLNLGPVPDGHRACQALIGLTPSPGMPPTVLINGKPCQLRSDTTSGAMRLLRADVPAAALAKQQAQEIRVVSADQSPLKIERVEMSLP
jgi:hypothetical protein